MKACPFCAEEIQDAAVVCKHCGRELKAAAANPSVARGKTSRGVLWIAVLGGAAVLGAALYFGGGGPGVIQQAGTPAPFVVRIADSVGVDVPAASYRSYTFEIADTRPCVVSGRVLGLAGGNKDVEVLLFDADGFINWKNNNAAKTLFNGSRATATTISARLPVPGTYHLVLNNAFSLLTPKTLQVSATARCG